VKPNSIASGAVGSIYQPIDEAIAKIARETPGLNLPLTDNLPALRAAHPAVSGLTIDTVLRVVTVPLHPGALRLYRERNIQQ